MNILKLTVEVNLEIKEKGGNRNKLIKTHRYFDKKKKLAKWELNIFGLE